MRSLWVLCLAAVFAFAPTGESWAGPPKVDLTEYLDGHPQVDDFWLIARSDGESVREDLLDLLEHKKSTEYLYQVNEAGDEHREIEELVHGKERRIGSVFYPNGVTLFVARPKRFQSFRVVPGKPQRYKVAMKVYYQDQRAGSATLVRTSTFVGFEPISTPLGDFDSAAHFHREQTLTLKVDGSVFTTVSTADSWIPPGPGSVRLDYGSTSFEDGVQTSTFGPFTYTLESGQYEGVPFP